MRGKYGAERKVYRGRLRQPRFIWPQAMLEVTELSLVKIELSVNPSCTGSVLYHPFLQTVIRRPAAFNTAVALGPTYLNPILPFRQWVIDSPNSSASRIIAGLTLRSIIMSIA